MAQYSQQLYRYKDDDTNRMIIETPQLKNIITIAAFPKHKYSFNDLKVIKNLTDYPDCIILGCFENLVMDTWRLNYNNELWDQATKLVITNETTAPAGNETYPTQDKIIFISDNQQQNHYETNRRRGNPYYIAYGIVHSDADGQWGSLSWCTSDNQKINRVRTPIRKDSGKIIFIELKASMIS